MNILNKFKLYPNKKDLVPFFKKFLFFYICVFIALFSFQRKVMYFPNTDSFINASHWTKIDKNNKTIAIKEISNNYSYNVLVFHGNAGNANMKDYYRLVFPEANIIIAEYPGFGFRSNETLNKENIIQASSEIVEEVLKDNKPLILFGESLGSGVASEMAIKYKIKNLVLATPYDDISKLAQSKFKFFPIYPFVFDRYNNDEVLQQYSGNLVLLISEFDQVIPNKFAYSLSEKLDKNKNIHKKNILIKKAGHNTYVSDFTEENRKELHHFLNLHYN